MALKEKITIGIDIRSALGRKTGIGYYTYSLVRSLAKLDQKNDYVLYTTKKVKWGLPTNFVQQIYPANSIFQKILFILRTWNSFSFKKEVDVFFSPAALTFATLGVFSKNVVLTIHDIVPKVMGKTAAKNVRFFFLQLPVALKYATKIVVPSIATKNDLENYTKVDPRKVSVTPEAAHEWCYQDVTEEQLKEVVAKYNLPKNYFLFVSTLEPRKNIPTLIKAFARFSYKDTQNYKLVIGGKKGWLYDAIFTEVEIHNLQDKIIFTDYIADHDLLPLYKQAKAFTFVPLMEGFGLTPLEAMVVGIPVITSNTSSLPEVVGDAAITVDPNDVTEISDALKKVANDEELREEMIEKGKKQSEKFSWDKCAKLTLEAIESVKE